MTDKIKEWGQVFTRSEQVEFMLALRQNKGRCLEPSVGEGAFWNKIPGCVGIELDAEICPTGCLNMDFFDYPTYEKFGTIIGNPPFVQGKRILAQTRAKLTSSIIPIKNNLYLHFIEKCFYHLEDKGELIFINPLDFLNIVSGSEKLNDLLMQHGTITHCYDLSGQNLFSKANPDSCCIWRYEKSKLDRVCTTNSGVKQLIHYNGKIYLTNKDYSVPFKDLFYIKVGGVPGEGNRFIGHGNKDFVYSKTKTTGKTRKMDYQPALWVRSLPSQDDCKNPRVYVNCKTMEADPFFTHRCHDWDGSILAIFPRNTSVDLKELTQALNGVDWADIGFMWHGKYVFSHGALTKCLLPPEFAKFKPTK